MLCPYIEKEAAMSKKMIPLLFALISAFSQISSAREFDASTLPRGRYLLKIYPKIFFASAGFETRIVHPRVVAEGR